jgi:small subunit ribosomal protein S20
LPHKRSAYKELRKSKKRHLRNISLKSDLKTSIKKFEKLLIDKKIDDAKKYLSMLVATLDKAASKGMLHKNAASRKVSRLTKRLGLSSKA